MIWDDMKLQDRLLLLKYARLLLQNKVPIGLAVAVTDKDLCVSQIPDSVLAEIENSIKEK